MSNLSSVFLWPASASYGSPVITGRRRGETASAVLFRSFGGPGRGWWWSSGLWDTNTGQQSWFQPSLASPRSRLGRPMTRRVAVLLRLTFCCCLLYYRRSDSRTCLLRRYESTMGSSCFRAGSPSTQAESTRLRGSRCVSLRQWKGRGLVLINRLGLFVESDGFRVAVVGTGLDTPVEVRGT